MRLPYPYTALILSLCMLTLHVAIAAPAALPKRQAAATTGVRTLTSDGSYWYLDTTIGVTQRHLLFDTGSSDTVLNAGRYIKGETSISVQASFSNSYITINADGSGSGVFHGRAYNDSMSLGTIGTTDQQLGELDADSPQYDGSDGIMGWAATRGSKNSLPARQSFVANLCADGALKPCYFGTALRGDRSGLLTLGQRSDLNGAKLFDPSKLVTVGAGHVNSSQLWAILRASPLVELTSNGASVSGSRVDVLAIDSGTSVTVTTRSEARNLFAKAGLTIVELDNFNRTAGTWPCDKPAPKIGFKIAGRQFDYDTAALIYARVPNKEAIPGYTAHLSARSWPELKGETLGKRDTCPPPVRHEERFLKEVQAAVGVNNTCVSSIFGDAVLERAKATFWVLGQTWMQGKYIEHNIDDQTMSFSPLLTP